MVPPATSLRLRLDRREPSLEGAGIEAGDRDDLVARRGAARYPDVASWDAEGPGQNADRGEVGAAVGRRRGHPDADHHPVDADAVPRRPWRDANVEAGLCRHGRSPKSARPIRTSVAPSSTATSKSSVMPMES